MDKFTLRFPMKVKYLVSTASRYIVTSPRGKGTNTYIQIMYTFLDPEEVFIQKLSLFTFESAVALGQRNQQQKSSFSFSRTEEKNREMPSRNLFIGPISRQFLEVNEKQQK